MQKNQSIIIDARLEEFVSTQQASSNYQISSQYLFETY